MRWGWNDASWHGNTNCFCSKNKVSSRMHVSPSGQIVPCRCPGSWEVLPSSYNACCALLESLVYDYRLGRAASKPCCIELSFRADPRPWEYELRWEFGNQKPPWLTTPGYSNCKINQVRAEEFSDEELLRPENFKLFTCHQCELSHHKR